MKLVERIAKKGKSIGQTFWGCKNYPRCRYKLHMCETGVPQTDPEPKEVPYHLKKYQMMIQDLHLLDIKNKPYPFSFPTKNNYHN